MSGVALFRVFIVWPFSVRNIKHYTTNSFEQAIEINKRKK